MKSRNSSIVSSEICVPRSECRFQTTVRGDYGWEAGMRGRESCRWHLMLVTRPGRRTWKTIKQRGRRMNKQSQTQTCTLITDTQDESTKWQGGIRTRRERVPIFASTHPHVSLRCRRLARIRCESPESWELLDDCFGQSCQVAPVLCVDSHRAILAGPEM